jgi:hypothetical protein
MNRKVFAALALIAAVAAGCSSTPTFQTGEDAEVTFDGLTRMEGTVMDVVWARTDIDLKGYSKVMFQGLGIEYREVSGPYSGRGGTTSSSAMVRSGQSEFQLDDATKALFEEEIAGAFLEEMAKSEVYEIAEEPAPEVLLIRAGLLDVISRVPPETMGRSRVWLDSVGEATLVLEIRSSVSNTIYARGVDRRAASSPTMTESNRATNRAEVRRLARRWATLLRSSLDKLLTEDSGQ